MIVCCSVHLLLHRRWIENALNRYARLPDAARANASINLVLFLGYMTCGSTGLLASFLPASPLNHLHGVCGLTMVLLQGIHILRH